MKCSYLSIISKQFQTILFVWHNKANMIFLKCVWCQLGHFDDAFQLRENVPNQFEATECFVLALVKIV